MYNKPDPCNPCLCPKAPCEQCMFGYKSIEDRTGLLNDIIINNRYPSIVERYNIYYNKRY